MGRDGSYTELYLVPSLVPVLYRRSEVCPGHGLVYGLGRCPLQLAAGPLGVGKHYDTFVMVKDSNRAPAGRGDSFEEYPRTLGLPCRVGTSTFINSQDTYRRYVGCSLVLFTQAIPLLADP